MEVTFQERVRWLFEDSEYGKKVLEYATMLSDSNDHHGSDYYLLNAIHQLLDRMEEIDGITNFDVE